METFILINLFVTGLFLIGFTFAMYTKNFISALLFKIIPFFLGLGCVFSGMKMIGWI